MRRIQDYRFGHVTVEGRELTRDVIVLPDRVVENWWRANGHELVWEDLEDVIDELPPRLVVGMGADRRMRPDPEALSRPIALVVIFIFPCPACGGTASLLARYSMAPLMCAPPRRSWHSTLRCQGLYL